MLVAGVSAPAAGVWAAATASTCATLGARVHECALGPDPTAAGEEAALDGAVAAAVRELSSLDLLAVDAGGLFSAGLAAAGSGHAALRACMDAAWNATRAVVNHAFLPSGGGGRVVYLAPAPDAGEHAGAAAAGLENLARTLSTEWARHGITTLTVAPGVQTAAGEVATILAYLASPAGAYFSGCLLDLRGAAPV